MRNALLALTILLLPSLTDAAELSAADLDRRRMALRKLLDEQWEYTLRRSPEYASILGDKRFNDQSSDVSAAATRADLAENRRFLAKFQAIDPRGFSEQEQVNRALMIQNLRDSIEDAELRNWMMPLTQWSGIHLNAAQLPSLLSFETAKDYDDYVTRLGNFPKQIDDTLAVMRAGLRARLMPPKFLLERAAGQAQDLASSDPEQSPFALPLSRLPAEIPPVEQERIRGEVLLAIRTKVVPAYSKLAEFLRSEYAPRGRESVGMSALPNGARMYEARVRQSTTTELSAEEIHQIGVREVARIEGEMLAIAQKLGYSDLKSFNASLEVNPEVRVKSAQHILDLYRRHTDNMYQELPKLFGRLPKAKLEIVPTEPFREKTAAGADYNEGAPDGSRPGRVNVNTYDATARKTISIESTAYHEGVPGHHMQISIAQELPNLPEFRRHGFYTAYVEGWALYSERLGREVGFYQDPYSDYGRLQDEMLRAIRLVVDTGLHARGWTRDQVVQYFHDHSALDEVEIQSETDRYIVIPGQALGYKIGQLRIIELRERARKALGERFDLRAFHDEVLGAGALPMNVLEARIDRWIGRQSAPAAAGG
jgi:uncharacterized protein (DUF885 family)